jgi:hypothetical protein
VVTPRNRASGAENSAGRDRVGGFGGCDRLSDPVRSAGRRGQRFWVYGHERHALFLTDMDRPTKATAAAAATSRPQRSSLAQYKRIIQRMTIVHTFCTINSAQQTWSTPLPRGRPRRHLVESPPPGSPGGESGRFWGGRRSQLLEPLRRPSAVNLDGTKFHVLITPNEVGQPRDLGGELYGLW